MIDAKKINELVQAVIGALPEGLKDLPKDAKANLHAAVQAAFKKVDLVTREEFDIQSKVLARTRAKLESLEKQVAELEKDESQ